MSTAVYSGTGRVTLRLHRRRNHAAYLSSAGHVVRGKAAGPCLSSELLVILSNSLICHLPGGLNSSVAGVARRPA